MFCESLGEGQLKLYLCSSTCEVVGHTLVYSCASVLYLCTSTSEVVGETLVY